MDGPIVGADLVQIIRAQEEVVTPDETSVPLFQRTIPGTVFADNHFLRACEPHAIEETGNARAVVEREDDQRDIRLSRVREGLREIRDPSLVGGDLLGRHRRVRRWRSGVRSLPLRGEGLFGWTAMMCSTNRNGESCLITVMGMAAPSVVRTS
jgi:hypothetical protein